MPRLRSGSFASLAALVLLACRNDAAAPATHADEAAMTAPPEKPADPAPAKGGGGSGGLGRAAAAKQGTTLDQAYLSKAPERHGIVDIKEMAPSIDPGAASGEAAVTTRAWFPETFLFEPLIVTDASGGATVPVKVPDRLTSWRILALAHARNGAQAGTTHSVLGTLPAYVDVVVPAFLVTGDEIRLPVQLVNTTERPLTAPLRLEIEGGALTGAVPGTVTVPAFGATVVTVTLVAGKPGTLSLRAQLGSTDAVLRTVDVLPYGRPASLTRAGSLAAPRTLAIAGAVDADPTTSRARLQLYPGALSLVSAELAGTRSRGGVAEDAYTLLLAGRAPALLTALGGKADAEDLRQLAILGTQRAVRHARTLDVTRATLFTEAALAHPANAILARLGERSAAWLADHQRPDGTFSGETGWTLQRLLVTTADAVRAVRSTGDSRRATAVSLKAQGAFERNAGRIDDPYTAAAILASGAAPPSMRAALEKLILDALVAGPDGARSLVIPGHVVRADGSHPSLAEASALAALALTDKTVLADLGAVLLGSYAPGRGWGDGRTNLVAFQAVTKLFRDPIPDKIAVTLLLDGKEVASGTLRAAEVTSLVADVPNATGAHEWQIVAEPPVAGLAYALTLEQWIPWSKQPREAGLEIALELPATLTAGKPAEVTLRFVAPGNTAVVVEQSLPAGVQPSTPSLQALVDSGTVSAFDTADGSVTLHFPPQPPGQVVVARFSVVPTLAGKLRASASTVSGNGQTSFAPPPVWLVR